MAGGSERASDDLPGSVLFACDHNAVRSPMAEGIMKRLFGTRLFVQSTGVHHDIDIDGFAIAVCEEIGVDLSRHRPRSFDEMEAWSQDIGAFDMIVALTPAAQHRAQEYTRQFSIMVEYWPTCDPTGTGETRAQKIEAYRRARDRICELIVSRFGKPAAPGN